MPDRKRTKLRLKPVREMSLTELQRELAAHRDGTAPLWSRRVYSLENELAKRGWH